MVHSLEGIGAKGIIVALIPGFVFFLFFIINHNVLSILDQSPKFNLTKPPAYHWDFFVLGLAFFPCAVALSSFADIAWIPTGCLFGLLLYLDMGALHRNEIWERVLLLGVYDHKRPRIPIVRHVPWGTVRLWTLIQLVCALAIWAGGQYAPVGYICPLLLTLLVPFRSYVLERCFRPMDVRHLDPVNETKEEVPRRVAHGPPCPGRRQSQQGG